MIDCFGGKMIERWDRVGFGRRQRIGGQRVTKKKLVY